MTEQTPDEIPSAVIPPREAHALRTVLAAMPYSGNVRRHAITSPWNAPLTVEDVTLHLAELRDVLGNVARRNEAQDREVAELRGQRRAVRSFIGLEAPLSRTISEAVREELREALDERERIAYVKAFAEAVGTDGTVDAETEAGK